MPLEDMALRTGGTPVPPLGEDQILEAIAAGDRSSLDIARASGMSILELAAHVCTAQNLEALERVKLLHATQQEMLLGRLRPRVLGRLQDLLSCARNRGSEIHNLRKILRNYLTRPQGLTASGCAGARANVVIRPFIVGQCF